MACNNEIWKVNKDFPKYEISSFGKVRNIKTGNILSGHITKDGYIAVTLRREGESRTRFIHRLVLETFNPIEEMNKLTVNHINEIKIDNRLENLEWMTNHDNVHYGTAIQRRLEAFNRTVMEQGGCRPVPVNVYEDEELTKLVASFDSVAEASRSGLNNYKNIYRAINRKNHFSKNYYYVRANDAEKLTK